MGFALRVSRWLTKIAPGDFVEKHDYGYFFDTQD
jgi:hypothetical protein